MMKMRKTKQSDSNIDAQERKTQMGKEYICGDRNNEDEKRTNE